MAATTPTVIYLQASLLRGHTTLDGPKFCSPDPASTFEDLYKSLGWHESFAGSEIVRVDCSSSDQDKRMEVKLSNPDIAASVFNKKYVTFYLEAEMKSAFCDELQTSSMLASDTGGDDQVSGSTLGNVASAPAQKGVNALMFLMQTRQRKFIVPEKSVRVGRGRKLSAKEDLYNSVIHDVKVPFQLTMTAVFIFSGYMPSV